MLDAVERAASPWHKGELELQRHVGVSDEMDTVGRRVLRSFLLEQHREFYPLLPFIVIGAVDPDGAPWATIRAGRPGFLHSPDPMMLSVDARSDPADPAERGMGNGDAIGLVGVDLITRRRNRLNGTIIRGSLDGFSVKVGHSFGNCPRYIQNRHFVFVRDPATRTSSTVVSDALTDAARRIIAAADTFFVASYADLESGRQVDVSHRGGKPGFVRLDPDGGLTVPDFNGNLFFNTLGNFMANPRGGMLFVDHETGDMLQLTGSVEVILESPELEAFEGAERLWRFLPEKIVLRQDALALRWTFAENGLSPNSLGTGSWAEAENRLAAATRVSSWTRLRVDKIVEESATIRSLYLARSDDEAFIPHQAGQHLPIRISDGGDFIRRSYTISSAPTDGQYRLSIKREGRVSQLLHRLRLGDEIEALAPSGAFTIDTTEQLRPAVLLAAGIGITPLLSMLRHLVHEGDRTRHRRPVWLFRSSRNVSERAFDREIGDLVERAQGAVQDVRVLSAPDARDKGLYEASGYIDINILKKHLPFGDYDFYLCGPSTFMQSMHDSLRTLNVAEQRIHAEAFGPSAMKRDALPSSIPARPTNPAATSPTPVIFTGSAKEGRWKPGDGSLLELAEKRGLTPSFSCRAGHCGECRTRIIKGDVSYSVNPSYEVSSGDALICCSVPADGTDLHLDL